MAAKYANIGRVVIWMQVFNNVHLFKISEIINKRYCYGTSILLEISEEKKKNELIKNSKNPVHFRNCIGLTIFGHKINFAVNI